MFTAAPLEQSDASYQTHVVTNTHLSLLFELNLKINCFIRTKRLRCHRPLHQAYRRQQSVHQCVVLSNILILYFYISVNHSCFL